MAGYMIACPLCPWERYGATADVVGRAWDKHAREKHDWRRNQLSRLDNSVTCAVCGDEGLVRVVDAYDYDTGRALKAGYQIGCPHCPKGRQFEELDKQMEGLT